MGQKGHIMVQKGLKMHKKFFFNTILLDNQVFTKLLVQSLYKKFKVGVKTKIFPHE